MSTKGYKRKYKQSYAPYKIPRMIVLPPKPELKRISVPIATMALNSIGNIWYEYDILGAVTASAAVSGRNGRKITLHSMRFRGNLFGGAVGAGGLDEYYNNVRFVIYGHRATKTGAALTPLGSSTISGTAPINNTVLSGLHKVYFDRMIPITNNPYAANNASPGSVSVDFFHRWKKPLMVSYTGDTTNFNQYSIYTAAISDSAAVPHPGFGMGYFEVTFYDN